MAHKNRVDYMLTTLDPFIKFFDDIKILEVESNE